MIPKVVGGLLAALLFGGCSPPGRPTSADIERSFVAENPGRKVSRVYLGEGDSDNVYYHIEYSDENAKSADSAVWLYQYIDGKWRRASSTTGQNTTNGVR
jgi:hypothetical protein